MSDDRIFFFIISSCGSFLIFGSMFIMAPLNVVTLMHALVAPV